MGNLFQRIQGDQGYILNNLALMQKIKLEILKRNVAPSLKFGALKEAEVNERLLVQQFLEVD